MWNVVLRKSHRSQVSIFIKNLSYRKKHQRYGPSDGLSYISNPGVEPLLSWHIGQLFDRGAKKYPDEEALVVPHQKVRRTYRQISKEVDDLAEGLLRIGLEKNDRVGIWGPNSHEWYVTHMAAAKAGLILVNINPAYEARELLYAVNRVKMKGIIIAETFKTQNYYNTLLKIMPSIKASQPGKVASPEAPSLSTIICMGSEIKNGTYQFEAVVDEGSKWKDKDMINKMSKIIQIDDVCNLQFTSGTTGLPKGVMLTHHNIVNNSYLIAKRFGYTSKDRICIPVPLFHCYGQVGGMLTALHNGSACVFPSEGFSAKTTLEVIEDESCTALYGTPTMHIDCLNTPEISKRNLTSLRIAVTAGSVCPEETVREMSKKYSCQVTSLYGLTETSPVIFQSLPEDSEEIRISTIGYPQEHTEVKIVDRDGNIVPVGAEGELCCRGYMTMLGYYDEPEKTQQVLTASKWFLTGDTCILLNSGHGKIVGRIKEMIIRGGENIYPKEIENFLHSNPHIAEAHVYGIKSKRLGEEVAVWIKLREGHTMTEDEVKSYCKGQISHFKIPKYIFFRDEFPKTQSGKIQKFKMREETMKILSVDEV